MAWKPGQCCDWDNPNGCTNACIENAESYAAEVMVQVLRARAWPEKVARRHAAQLTLALKEAGALTPTMTTDAGEQYLLI